MKMKLIYGFLLATAVTFCSCSDDNDGGSSEGTGKMSVRLTDAPFPTDMVSEANVTIFKVDARKADDTDEASFVTLMENEVNVNLLDLTNGVTEPLADMDVPVGTYNLVRVYVKGVNVVLKDGTTYDLKVPSGEQTGIKVFITPGLTVTGGISSDLLLDFDVSRSFVAKGNINTSAGISGFNFKPVIKACNLSTAGTLSGKVETIMEETETPLAGAQVSVYAADTLNTTTFTDVDGHYSIMGLAAGSYTVMAELNGYIATEPLDVQIDAANVTSQDFMLEADGTASTDN